MCPGITSETFGFEVNCITSKYPEKLKSPYKSVTSLATPKTVAIIWKWALLHIFRSIFCSFKLFVVLYAYITLNLSESCSKTQNFTLHYATILINDSIVNSILTQRSTNYNKLQRLVKTTSLVQQSNPFLVCKCKSRLVIMIRLFQV